MAIEIKRQQLLNKKPKGKKPNSAEQKNSQSQKVPQQAQQKQTKTSSKATQKSATKKFTQIMLGAFILGLIIVPKPKLLVYKKLDLVGQSIYLPGWFGTPGQLLDSKQRVIIEDSLGLVYLCYQENLPKEHCNRFKFVEQKGMIAAIIHYKDNNM